jgi:hypothetical protein
LVAALERLADEAREQGRTEALALLTETLAELGVRTDLIPREPGRGRDGVKFTNGDAPGVRLRPAYGRDT